MLCLAAETKVGQDESKYFPKKRVLVLPHSWQSLWNYLTGPPTNPGCKEVTQHILEQDKRGEEGQRDKWQTYFLIRNSPEPSTTSQSSPFGSLETSSLCDYFPVTVEQIQRWVLMPCCHLVIIKKENVLSIFREHESKLNKTVNMY